MGRKRKRIAVGIDLNWPYKHHQGVARGIMLFAEKKGWDCVLDPFLGAPEKRRTGEPRPDGIIARATPRIAAYARRMRIPAVNVWQNSPDRSLPRVVSDNEAAGRLAADHLLTRGFRRFAFLGGRRDRNTRLHLKGFLGPVQRAGFKVMALSVPVAPRSHREWTLMRRSLERWVPSWERPIGVYVSNDLLARYLADACLRAGLRIPDDAGLMSAGNTEIICELLNPALTSIELGFEQVGWRAGQVLDRLMAGHAPPSRPIRIPPNGIVERRSTDIFAVPDPQIADILRTIWRNAGRPFDVRTLTRSIPMSRRTLERRFRELLGRSVYQEIQRSRLDRAKGLLVRTAKPLKQVATESGFRNPGLFSRAFRRLEGLTPREYRIRHQAP